MKRGRRHKGDTWWWNEEVKKAALWMKDAHKVMCQINIEENKRRCKSMKNKAVSKLMREKTEEEINELQNCANGMFWITKRLKTDSKEVGRG